MKLSLAAFVLWAAGFLANAALLTVLIVRKRVRLVPWFTAWVGFQLFYTLTLFVAYRFGTKHTYALLYWTGAFLDLGLQVAVVVEIAGYVFRRGRNWVGDTGRLLVWSGLIAALMGAALGWWMTPLSGSGLDALESRVDLGATVLIVVLFTSVMVLSERAGVGWRNLVLREGYGVAVWSMASFITDTLHAYWRTAEHFAVLEHLRIVAYLGAVGYWTVVFWLPEAVLEPSAASKRSMERLLREVD